MSEPVDCCQIALGIRDAYDTPIMTFPSILTMDVFSVNAGSHYADCIIEKLPLTEGVYNIALYSSIHNNTADYLASARRLSVVDDDFFNLGRTVSSHLKGRIVLCDHHWIVC